ncbi:MAG: C-GCAxxG-C-C family protein [Pontiellaceae bacterium]|jgi:hypothetical protein|nr:C-GCAxxG-C-C family protein [Pontiellaceae bacterium]
MKKTAVDHYKNGRGNCAQAVALAWKDKKQPESEHHSLFSGCGGGRAPEGLCGAVHAACELAGGHQKETIKEQFKARANGQITCKEIRRNRIMTCTECVTTAAELLEELTKETPQQHNLNQKNHAEAQSPQRD